jgi:hypothetical protein
MRKTARQASLFKRGLAWVGLDMIWGGHVVNAISIEIPSDD